MSASLPDRTSEHLAARMNGGANPSRLMWRMCPAAFAKLRAELRPNQAHWVDLVGLEWTYISLPVSLDRTMAEGEWRLEARG